MLYIYWMPWHENRVLLLVSGITTTTEVPIRLARVQYLSRKVLGRGVYMPLQHPALRAGSYISIPTEIPHCMLLCSASRVLHA